MSATWHLDRLATALERQGWSVERLYGLNGASSPLLRVRHPDVRVFGESVSVSPCADGRLWFQSSEFRLLAPVRNPGTAAAQLIAILTPYTGTVGAVRDPASGGHRRSRAGLVRWLLMICRRRA